VVSEQKENATIDKAATVFIIFIALLFIIFVYLQILNLL